MSRPLTWMLLAALLVSLPGGPRAAAAPEQEAALESARRLTWKAETREAGIASLRRLVAKHPDGVEARLELGRVLTWKQSTRAEGIRLLRAVHAEVPQCADVTEALAEVLTWNPGTREEAIGLLRRLGRDHPEWVSARLVLAEVLSWDRSTLNEAIGLYRKTLAQSPDSAKARLGLARTLSWQGDLEASRTLYEEALAREPGDPVARLGLAEVERWSGRSRISLRVLGTLSPEETDSPAAHARRGDAYADLGRPALALAEYDAILAVDPDNEAARRGANHARRKLRPSLETGASGSTESGDPRTSKVQILSLPITYRWHPAGDAEVRLLARPAFYDNDRGTTETVSAGATFETPVGLRSRLHAQVMGHDFEDTDSEITGRLEWRVAASDRVVFRVGGERELLQDSRLSAVGESLGGLVFGPAVQTEAFLEITVHPGRAWDASLRGATGTVEGDNLRDNDRRALFGGFGRSFHLGNAWLRPGYSATWFSFDRDLSGFPPGDLAGDGVDSRGVGGYFSPFRFLNQMVRLDTAWSMGQRLEFSAGGGIGLQQVEDIGSPDFDDTTTSSDAYFRLQWQIALDVALRASVSHQDVASAFDRTRGGISLIWTF
ncbi:MAG: tetratricopeptide repeat protein [Acidobacteriota bacterium]